jgi:hypothetical protein
MPRGNEELTQLFNCEWLVMGISERSFSWTEEAEPIPTKMIVAKRGHFQAKVVREENPPIQYNQAFRSAGVTHLKLIVPDFRDYLLMTATSYDQGLQHLGDEWARS